MHSISHPILDRLAISMAVICGIHCLVTPILLVALPIIATTFWVHENFHLWMLLLVIPTTSLAVWSGCRRHKDRWVMGAAALGIGILVMALVTERVANAQLTDHHATLSQESSPHVAGGGCCALHPAQPISTHAGHATTTKSASIHWHALLNTLGGLFLVGGHTRNFMLCRKSNCSHAEEHC